jgi:hypothetical protein
VVKMIGQRFPEAPTPDVSVRTTNFPAGGETADELVAHLKGPSGSETVAA